MPILLRCDELEPGMRLFEPLIWRGRTLLAAGGMLTRAEVDVLRGKYPQAHVRVGDPILDNVIEFEDDTRDREVADTVRTTIAAGMSEVSERFSSRASISSLNLRAARHSVAEVLEYLKANPVSAALLSRSLETDSYLSEHAGNVFYLSMILGCAVRDYVDSERRQATASRHLDPEISMDLLPLGLGAMFCDVGMLPLRHLYTSRDPLTNEDRRAIREHPKVGAAMLPESFAPAGRSVVRTHHENFDGSGYPDGIEGHRSHVLSRIVRIADAYDAATATHVYREAKSPARALWEMSCGPYSQHYDPVLMKVFARLIQPFPIGAKLRLRDGRYGVVVRYNRLEPFKPSILIAYDINGQRLAKDKLEGPLSLADRTDLRIEMFGDERLSFLYSFAIRDELVPRPEEFRTLFQAGFP